MRYSYVQLFVTDDGGNEQEIRIEHFPYYGVRAIKKACPAVEAKMSKRGKISVTVYLFLPFVVPFIVAVIKNI